MEEAKTGYLVVGCVIAWGIWAGCQAMMPPANPKMHTVKVYVANESSNSVTIIDGNTFKVLGEVNTLNHGTHDLSLTRNGKRLWATNLASGRISVIDTDSMKTIASIYTGKLAHGVALDNTNRMAWVANQGDDMISIVSTLTYQVIGTIPVSKGPKGIAFSRNGMYAYVSTKDNYVKVIDLTSQKVIKAVPVGPNPHFLVVGPQGRIWGTNSDRNDIFIIDPEMNEVTHKIVVGPAPQQIAFGFNGAQGPNAYVTVAGINKIVIVRTDNRTPQIGGRIDVGESPNGIWANSVGTRLYVGHTESNDLKIIDTGTNNTLATVPVGQKPIRVVASH